MVVTSYVMLQNVNATIVLSCIRFSVAALFSEPESMAVDDDVLCMEMEKGSMT